MCQSHVILIGIFQSKYQRRYDNHSENIILQIILQRPDLNPKIHIYTNKKLFFHPIHKPDYSKRLKLL